MTLLRSFWLSPPTSKFSVSSPRWTYGYIPNLRFQNQLIPYMLYAYAELRSNMTGSDFLLHTKLEKRNSPPQFSLLILQLISQKHSHAFFRNQSQPTTSVFFIFQLYVFCIFDIIQWTDHISPIFTTAMMVLYHSITIFGVLHLIIRAGDMCTPSIFIVQKIL